MKPSPTEDRQPQVRYIALVALTVLTTGVVFYHHVEKLSWVDSLYFCMITLATVGYGDITPKTTAGKLFTVFYVIIGIGIFAASANFLIKRAATRRWNRRYGEPDDKK